MTITRTDLDQLRGKPVVDPEGDKIGKVEEIYLDTQTGEAAWATVTMGLFGSNVSFVPLTDAHADGDGVRVAWDKETVKNAPNADPSRQLTGDEEVELYRHYGFDYSQVPTDAGPPEPEPEPEPAPPVATSPEPAPPVATSPEPAPPVATSPEPAPAPGPGYDTSGPSTDSAMTRSEEELRVGTVREESARVRLRKYVVTENVTTTVPVQREEVRIEREPVTEGNAGQALDGPAISEEEHEVVLHEERPIVEKQVVPKERVRLDTETRTEEAQVSEEVRKEQIDVDDQTRR